MPTTEETPKEVTVRDLLDAGLHFGHQTKRWNPKMRRYIFDKRNGIHIIDLAKSMIMLNHATEYIKEVVLAGRNVLFVGTKKQAQQVTERVAKGCNQFFVNTRWLGGTLTNNATIRKRIKYLRELEAMEKDGRLETMHKKEAARARHELAKLRRNLGGIADMTNLPGALLSLGYMVGILPVLKVATSAQELRTVQAILLLGGVSTLSLWTVVRFSCTTVAAAGTVLGCFASVFTVAMFGSPLTTLKTVLAERNSATLLRRLALAQIANSLLWTAYGITKKERVRVGSQRYGTGPGPGAAGLSLCDPVFEDDEE